jgi:adenylate cyclase
VERRLTAILAMDMVGYSRLMAIDETGVLARHKEHRGKLIDPRLVEYHGRIVKTTGDGLLAEFPSVVDAFRCAVGIQLSLRDREAEAPPDRRIAYRIGINLGDILMEDDDIFGDGVNIAARLEKLAESGGICVSQTVVDHVMTKVASSFEDLGEQSLKNIPTAVRAYRVLMQREMPGEAAPSPHQKPAKRLAWAAGLLLVVATVALPVYRAWEDVNDSDRTATAANGPLAGEEISSAASSAKAVEKAAIAVLPFQNLSAAADQEYFNDGITEDIITDLSKLPELLVISRNSTFRYKDREIDPREVGGDLGAQYLLTGSVRRTGDEVRINARLIDTGSGANIWAERYDGTLADVFALQGEVASQIANALALNLAPGTMATARQGETDSPEAYDLFLRGWEHFRRRTPEHQARALEYFKRAIEIDPNYARAHAAIASVYWSSFVGGWLGTVMPEEPDLYERRDKALRHVEWAMEDPASLAFQVRSRINLYRGRHEESLADAREAVRLDPNNADALTTLAEVLIFAGRPQEALDPLENAKRLDPHNRSYHSYLQGLAYFGRGKYEDALAYLERALELGPDEWSSEIGWRTYSPLYSLLAASYAYLGREKKAAEVVTEMKKGWAKANVATEVTYWSYGEDSDRQRLAKGLRLAGLPEY